MRCGGIEYNIGICVTLAGYIPIQEVILNRTDPAATISAFISVEIRPINWTLCQNLSWPWIITSIFNTIFGLVLVLIQRCWVVQEITWYGTEINTDVKIAQSFFCQTIGYGALAGFQKISLSTIRSSSICFYHVKLHAGIPDPLPDSSLLLEFIPR